MRDDLHTREKERRAMRKAKSHPNLTVTRSFSEGIEYCEETLEDEEMRWNYMQGGSNHETEDMAERLQRLAIQQRSAPPKRGEELSSENYDLWRQEQKSRAARLEKQLKARWELEELVEEQLNRFQAHYKWDMAPNHLKDVAQLLMPRWAPPHELASFFWLGEWRPSNILGLLRVLCSSSLPISSASSELLSQSLHEIRIEEAIIDEEMAEIQANSILQLPFGPVNTLMGNAAMKCIQSEFKKIERVITKAQHLRYKALDTVVKKVLIQTDAAEFLVAFEGIQDAVHLYAAHQRLKKGAVMVPIKALEPK